MMSSSFRTQRRRHDRWRACLSAVLLVLLLVGTAAVPAYAHARIGVFIGGGFWGPVYPYPYPYAAYAYPVAPYAVYAPPPLVVPPVWVRGYWTWGHDGWGRRARVWVPPHRR